MDEGDVEITFQPFKELIIMERNYFASPEEIGRFTAVITGGKIGGIYWAEGVLFLYFPLPASTSVTAKALVEQGRAFWTFVGYAFMPKYQPTLETKEKFIVPIIDMSSNAMFRKVANWLKEQKTK